MQRGEVAMGTVRNEITPDDIAVIQSMAQCDMNVTKVALSTHYSYSSVYYRLAQIKKITGYDPKTFYGLRKLVSMYESTK